MSFKVVASVEVSNELDVMRVNVPPSGVKAKNCKAQIKHNAHKITAKKAAKFLGFFLTLILRIKGRLLTLLISFTFALIANNTA